MKENKAKFTKRYQERAKKNCERVFFTFSRSYSYGDIMDADHWPLVNS